MPYGENDFQLSICVIALDGNLSSRDHLMLEYYDTIGEVDQAIETHEKRLSKVGYEIWTKSVKKWDGKKYTDVELQQ